MTKRLVFWRIVVPGFIICFVFSLIAYLSDDGGRFAMFAALALFAGLISIIMRLVASPGRWSETLGPQPAAPVLHLRPWVRVLLGKKNKNRE